MNALATTGQWAENKLITMPDLCAAIQRCCEKHPPVETQLHADASLMSELYGLMIYEKLPACEIKRVPPEVIAVLRRWDANFLVIPASDNA